MIQIAFEKVLIELPFTKTATQVAPLVIVTSKQVVGLSEISYRYTSSPGVVKTSGEFLGGQLILKHTMDPRLVSDVCQALAGKKRKNSLVSVSLCSEFDFVWKHLKQLTG